MKISGITYMGSKRKLIQKGLINLFPQNIYTFVDLFGGSGIVGMNVEAMKYVINDIDNKLYSFYQMFKFYDEEYIINKILSNINKFGLIRKSIKQNTEEFEYYKPKYIEMRKYANTSSDIIDLYSCIFYAFSQQMRFNSNGFFNMPFGNRAFVKEHENNIVDTCKYFQKAKIFNKRFNELKIDKLTSKDFVYLDPPYSTDVCLATYNESRGGIKGWDMQDDEDLFKLCENLNDNNIKWGMSNVFENKSKINQHLIDWCNKNNWNVYTFNKHSYSACGKGNSNAKEVYICNYEIGRTDE